MRNSDLMGKTFYVVGISEMDTDNMFLNVTSGVLENEADSDDFTMFKTKDMADHVRVSWVNSADAKKEYNDETLALVKTYSYKVNGYR
jgi:hypothetical protein